MYPTIALLFISLATVMGQSSSGAGLKSSLVLDRICVYDGLKYKTLISAMSDCNGNGVPVIPPTYSGQDPANAKNPLVMDLRHPENVKGLTPVNEFGAKGDAESRADGATQSGFATLTAASSAFLQGRDEGKAIVITGAGPENGSLTTTIKSVDSPSRVTLAAPAGFTASGLTYWFGTDNTSAFQKAYSSRRPLFLPAGKFLMTGTVKGTTPLFLIGSGTQAVIIDDTTVFSVHGTGGHFLDNFRMQAATKLTPLAPRAFPTPHAGTPVAVDRAGAGVGYQPEPGDVDVWPKLSKQQQDQQIGPELILSSDGIHIYGITGDLISILLFDVQFSEVAQCDFRAGKNFAGGILLWHNPKGGAANRDDSIHDNSVHYSSFSGIAWAASQNVSIKHNLVDHSGESGLKNYSSQSDGTFNTRIEVIGNHSQYNHYDGLDLSESFPHSNSQRASSVSSDNVSSFNDRTGAFVDGHDWKLVNNILENNGLTGLSIDVSDSIISGNVLTHNNTLHEGSAHQILIGPGRPSTNNVIERNRITGDAASGAAIKLSAASSNNQVRNNTATGGALFRFETAPSASQGNSDSHGRYPDR